MTLQKLLRLAKEQFREMEERASCVMERQYYAGLAREAAESEPLELADICPELLDRVVTALHEAYGAYECDRVVPHSVLSPLTKLCDELSKLSEQRWALEGI